MHPQGTRFVQIDAQTMISRGEIKESRHKQLSCNLFQELPIRAKTLLSSSSNNATEQIDGKILLKAAHGQVQNMCEAKTLSSVVSLTTQPRLLV